MCLLLDIVELKTSKGRGQIDGESRSEGGRRKGPMASKSDKALLYSSFT